MLQGRLALSVLLLLGFDAVAFASVTLIPVIPPDRLMEDGNGHVKTVDYLGQLQDGRILLTIGIDRAYSPTTGLPLPTNAGGYDYNFQTQQLVREYRYDYPAAQGGILSSVPVTFSWADFGFATVQENGDRVYAARGSRIAVYRYRDGIGLMTQIAPTDLLRLNWIAQGWGGHLATKSGQFDTTNNKMLDLAPDGTKTLIQYGGSVPGVGAASDFLTTTDGSIPAGTTSDGWVTFAVDTQGEPQFEYYWVRGKYGQAINVLRNPQNNSLMTFTAFYSVKPTGAQSLALFGQPGLFVQSAPNQPVKLITADHSAPRGDNRIWSGGQIVRGFRDGGFLMDLRIQDSSTSALIGEGVGLYTAEGNLLRNVLPGDQNPLGAGTVRDLSIDRALSLTSAATLQALVPPILIGANLNGTPRGSLDNTAYWRLDRDATLHLEYQTGTTKVPGTAKFIGSAGLIGITADGRSIYRALYEGIGNPYRTSAFLSYKPGVGLQTDLKAEDDGASDGWTTSQNDFALGPMGGRAYFFDNKIWKADDGAAPSLLAWPGKEVAPGLTISAVDRVFGFTAQDNLISRLRLSDSSSGLFISRGDSLVELVRFGDLLDGRTITSGTQPAMDSRFWVGTTAWGDPILRVQFSDGTSGIYTIPEPGSLLLCAAMAMLLGLGCRCARTARPG